MKQGRGSEKCKIKYDVLLELTTQKDWNRRITVTPKFYYYVVLLSFFFSFSFAEPLSTNTKQFFLNSTLYRVEGNPIKVNEKLMSAYFLELQCITSIKIKVMLRF